jgi:anti-anti-sigma factor
MSSGAGPLVPGPAGSDGPWFQVSQAAGVTVLFVAGEVDITAAAQLRDALARGCSAAGDRLVVDVSGLAYLDLAGVRGLLHAHDRLLADGRAGIIVRGASRIVRRIFEITGYTSLLGDWPPTAARGSGSPHAGETGRELEIGRRHADLSLQDLFVTYFALGGTADLEEMAAHLAGRARVLDAHQRDVAAHAVNERLADLGCTEHLLSYAADQEGPETGLDEH